MQPVWKIILKHYYSKQAQESSLDLAYVAICCQYLSAVDSSVANATSALQWERSFLNVITTLHSEQLQESSLDMHAVLLFVANTSMWALCIFQRSVHNLVICCISVQNTQLLCADQCTGAISSRVILGCNSVENPREMSLRLPKLCSSCALSFDQNWLQPAQDTY